MISRRRFIAGASSAAMTRAARARMPQPSKRPNVIVIMADDHGAWANHSYGCPDVHTPHLDALAASGTRFQNALACTPVCSPSRMTYLTGVLPSTHGVQDYLLPKDSCGPKSREWLSGLQTYTELIAAQGYNMGMCGKWHMGKDEDAQVGFMDWNTVPSGGGTYKDPTFVCNGATVKIDGFREDAIGNFALEFLDKQRNSTKPFFLAVNFYAPHTPYNYQPDRYREPNLSSKFSCFPDIPMNPAEHPEFRSFYGKQEPKLAYLSLITSIDANMGRIMDKLESLGVREETVIIYTADHGWNAGQHGVWGKGNGTIPLNMYEESIRVPLLWNHPQRIRAGMVVEEPVSSYDFFPTILDYLDISHSQNSKRVGKSYAPALTGRRMQARDRLYFEYASVRCVRTKRLKYVERADGWPSELYDLSVDPKEANNRIADPAYASQLSELRSNLKGFFDSIGAPPIAEWRSTTRQSLPWESNTSAPGFTLRSKNVAG